MNFLILLLRLFFEFFKTGLFAVGGGMATLPFLSDIADRTGWYTQAELSDMLAVAQSTPGPIGINVATYAGYNAVLEVTGNPFLAVLGGIVATLGEITPCIIIILIVARMLQKFRENRYVDAVFSGLRPASTGLIAASLLSVAYTTLFFGDAWGSLAFFNIKSIVFFVVLLLATRLIPFMKKLSPLWLIILSAVVGIIFKL